MGAAVWRDQLQRSRAIRHPSRVLQRELAAYLCREGAILVLPGWPSNGLAGGDLWNAIFPSHPTELPSPKWSEREPQAQRQLAATLAADVVGSLSPRRVCESGSLAAAVIGIVTTG